MLWYLGSYWPWKGLSPHKVFQVLETVNNHPPPAPSPWEQGARLSNANQLTIQSTNPPPPPLLGFWFLSCYPPALITPGPDTKHLGKAPMHQSPLKSFKITNLNPPKPALPIPSHKNYNKGSFPQFSLLSLLTNPALSCVLPSPWMWCLFLMGTERSNNCFFQWQSSSDLNNNKTY